MNYSALISLGVTAAFFVAATLIGFRLERSPKPYPIPLLSAHIALFFLIAIGIGVCMNKIDAGTKALSPATVSLCCAGPSLIALLVSGVVMICSKQKRRGWMLMHKAAMYFLALSLLAGGVLTALKR
jgi:hypothetical protein